MIRWLVSSVLMGALLLSTRLTVQARSAAPPFYFGVDLSYTNEMDDCGAVYRENGEPRDAFELFRDHGATLVRARLWHNPDWTTYSTLDDVKRTFTRARAAGMDTLLDLHYSDNWADPGRQEIPSAWADITDDAELAEAVYAYTTDVLQELHRDDLTPAFVQVGNEINSGLLKAGEVKLDWPRERAADQRRYSGRPRLCRRNGHASAHYSARRAAGECGMVVHPGRGKRRDGF